MKEKEMRRPPYRIAEFAKMVGIDPSTVCYYEKQGLRGKERAENGYRIFDEQDAFQMNTFRSINARGYSISEALKRMEPTDPVTIVRELEEKSAAMERERLLLEGRRQWTEETLFLMRKVAAGEPLFWRTELEDFYYLPASRRGDFSITQKNGQVRSDWEEWLGYTRFVALGDSAALCRSEHSLIGLGEAVKVCDFERLGYLGDDTVRRIPMGDCLCFSGKKLPRNGGAAGYDEVREYLDRHDLEPWGEYLEFFFMLYTGEDVVEDGIIAMPVQKRE